MNVFNIILIIIEINYIVGFAFYIFNLYSIYENYDKLTLKDILEELPIFLFLGWLSLFILIAILISKQLNKLGGKVIIRKKGSQ